MPKALFDQALQALHQGDRATAFQLLRQVILADSRYAPAWYWLSTLVDDDTQKRECLERALAVDPNYREAKDALEALKLRDVIASFRSPVFEERRREPARLGQALVQKGLITDAQLQEALREQHQEQNRGKKTMLGMVLLRRKVISPLALASILVDQQEQRSEPDRLGDYLLTRGLISRERLEQALAEHALTNIYEKPIRFGELLVQRKYIRREDLDKALEEQRQDAYNKYYY
ncbi:MAG: hypothetical protein Fur005_22470 [Roseiflexaceae bacterium]